MAFDFFADAGVDVAVIETGLGGRLDATNVVTPRVAGVTTIGIDHVEYLGATLEEIAFEKAGIFKRGVPAVVGEPDPAIRGCWPQRATRRRIAGARDCDEAARPAMSSDDPRHAIRLTLSATDGRSRRRCSARIRRRTPRSRSRCSIAAGGLASARTRDASHAAGARAAPRPVPAVGSYLFDVAHNPRRRRGSSRDARRRGRPSAGGGRAQRALGQGLARHHGCAGPRGRPVHPHERAHGAAEPHLELPDPLALRLERGWRAEVSRTSTGPWRGRTSEGATVLVTGSFHTVGDAMARLEVSPYRRLALPDGKGALPGFRDFYPDEFARARPHLPGLARGRPAVRVRGVRRPAAGAARSVHEEERRGDRRPALQLHRQGWS